jgi:hypothetical protein
VSLAGVQVAAAPYDHFAASPYNGMLVSFGRCVTSASRCPTIAAGIVSPASVKVISLASTSSSAPDNHVAPCPNSAMQDSAARSVIRARGCPSIGSRIVSSARIQGSSVDSAPDDHGIPDPDPTVVET